jgi:hypothetical protein
MSLVAAGTLALALFAPPQDERFAHYRKRTLMNRPIPLRPSFPRGDEQNDVPATVRNAFAFAEPANWSRWREAIRSSHFVELLGWAPPRAGHAASSDADAAPSGESDLPLPPVEPVDMSSRAFAEEVERVAAATRPVLDREDPLAALDRSYVTSTDVGTGNSEPPRSQEPSEENDERAPEANFPERPHMQPPLTRLPLRSQPSAVSWPLLLPNPREMLSEADRLQLLSSFTFSGATVPEAPLCSAYREEGAAGRILALKALANANGEFAREVVREASRYGSDDERTIAIDVLANRGDREALAAALCDRVEAIAARAALGYVGSFERVDYERALEPLVSKGRLEAILALLAGILT